MLAFSFSSSTPVPHAARCMLNLCLKRFQFSARFQVGYIHVSGLSLSIAAHWGTWTFTALSCGWSSSDSGMISSSTRSVCSPSPASLPLLLAVIAGMTPLERCLCTCLFRKGHFSLFFPRLLHGNSFNRSYSRPLLTPCSLAYVSISKQSVLAYVLNFSAQPFKLYTMPCYRLTNHLRFPFPVPRVLRRTVAFWVMKFYTTMFITTHTPE